MANPGGGNQFGNYTLQPQYGDVKKQTELTREAPMSGAIIPGRALNAPRRAQKQAGRPQRQPGPQAAPSQAGAPMPPAQISPQAFAAQAWQQIAAIPGASPLVQQYAARSSNG